MLGIFGASIPYYREVRTFGHCGSGPEDYEMLQKHGVIYSKTVKWTDNWGCRHTTVTGIKSPFEQEALDDAWEKAKALGWTPPRWWQWWRWGDTKL